MERKKRKETVYRMRKRGRSSAGRWALGALLVVALVGGVAWADSQSVVVPPGEGATVVAVLVPGDGGLACVGPERGDEHVEFNVRGEIEVNGELAGPYDAAGEYTVTLVYRLELGAWVVDTTIENGEGLVFVQLGHPVLMAPEKVSASGEDVISLSAE